MNKNIETFADYKEYHGTDTEQMPKLIADGRVPIIVPQIMQKRLETVGTFEENYFWNNYFGTATIIGYHPDGRVRIGNFAGNEKLIYSINPKSNIRNGALVINDKFESLIGKEFSRNCINKFANKHHKSAEEVYDDPLWIELAGKDVSLLEEYAKKDFELAKKYGHSSERMGVWLHDAPQKAIMRLCYIIKLKDLSDAVCNYNPGDIGQLLGIGGKEAVPVHKKIVTVPVKELAKLSDSQLN